MGPKTALRRVVLDTNALVSALLFTGPAHRLVELWKSDLIHILASGEVVEEYARVLGYPKFKLSEDEALGLLREEVLPFIVPVRSAGIPPQIEKDPSDDKFLACAWEGRAQAVVSGDKHLLSLGRFRGIGIVSVREFLDQWLT